MLRIFRILALGVLLATVPPSLASASDDPGYADVVLPVPHRTQLDGTVWAESNCGPATIGMVLESFGVDAPTGDLRDRANELLGMADPSTGTRLQDLAQVVREHGLSPNGLYQGEWIRQWSLDEVRQEVMQGRPVVAQVRLDLLPNHGYIPIAIDHYITIVGLSGEDFLFNDSAQRGWEGYQQLMTPQQFKRTWGASDFPFAGFSVAAPRAQTIASGAKISSRGSTAGGSWPPQETRRPERGALLVDELRVELQRDGVPDGTLIQPLAWPER